ncbi:hypothetical protein [Vibrio phage VP16T]|nr:hypothetical protein [Vibrio phage VP16T]
MKLRDYQRTETGRRLAENSGKFHTTRARTFMSRGLTARNIGLVHFYLRAKQALKPRLHLVGFCAGSDVQLVLLKALNGQRWGYDTVVAIGGYAYLVQWDGRVIRRRRVDAERDACMVALVRKPLSRGMRDRDVLWVKYANFWGLPV